MKILVFAYQLIGYAALSYLIDYTRRRVGSRILAVITHKDNPNEKIWFPSCASLAKSNNIPLYYSEDFQSTKDLLALVKNFGPQMLFSFYYRKIIPNEVLSIPTYGGINLHGSLLPRYRGCAPANWVIINDEPKTGVTLHRMTSKLDAGPIIAQKEIPIAPFETIKTLYKKLVAATYEILAEWYPKIEKLDFQETPQIEDFATYFKRRTPEDGKINWNWPLRKIDCLIRAITDPYPGAFTYIGGKKLIIWSGNYSIGGGKKYPTGTGFEIDKKMSIFTKDGIYKINSYTYEGNLTDSFKKGVICEF